MRFRAHGPSGRSSRIRLWNALTNKAWEDAIQAPNTTDKSGTLHTNLVPMVFLISPPISEGGALPNKVFHYILILPCKVWVAACYAFKLLKRYKHSEPSRTFHQQHASSDVLSWNRLGPMRFFQEKISAKKKSKNRLRVLRAWTEASWSAMCSWHGSTPRTVSLKNHIFVFENWQILIEHSSLFLCCFFSFSVLLE